MTDDVTYTSRSELVEKQAVREKVLVSFVGYL